MQTVNTRIFTVNPRHLIKRHGNWVLPLLIYVWSGWGLSGLAASALKTLPGPAWEGPNSLAMTPDGRSLLVACAKSRRVLALDPVDLRVIKSIPMPGAPSGIAFSADGQTLYVTCAGVSSCVAVVNFVKGTVTGRIPAGHTALAPVLANFGKTLYVCNRFNNSVSVIDLVTGKESGRIAVDREPVSAALTPDGKMLLVANYLHGGRADIEPVAAWVTVIDTVREKVLRQLELPNGAGLLHEVRVSPEGRYACVTHVLSRFQLPTSQIERAWINSNALTLIDLSRMEVLNTVLLDNAENGAANPWACGWSTDGKWLFITHAGTHEVSLIDFAGLCSKLLALPTNLDSQRAADFALGSRTRSEVPNDLGFLSGLRDRIRLEGKGPRAALVQSSRLIIASYFSDTIEVLDLDHSVRGVVQQAQLGADKPMDVLHRGEFLFNDASICYQGWQSCASCHGEDARVDALNWDLLNDGLGNPKNTKSLLLAHRTPPTMSLGIRETSEVAVRAGIRSVLFTVQPDETANAIDQWLKSLKPIPSPFLVDNQLSPAARRGEVLFFSPQTRCAGCHPRGLYTNLKQYDVGTQGASDATGALFDTPTLIELWRTAPYLHDGSASTVREVLTDHNRLDLHGRTSHLTQTEVDDLAAFLMSL